MVALIVLFIAWVVGAGLIGWLVPSLFKSEPPYGLGVDILASVIPAVVLGLLEWLWLLAAIYPVIPLTGGWKLAAAIGDPLGLALVVLWVLRRLKG